MTSLIADRIRAHLNTVTQLREARHGDPALAERVRSIKTYQAKRFEKSYADLLASPRYRAATRFFLDELYGPQEFGDRDSQFARVVPGLVRLFPHEVVETVEALGQLHALSEALDDTVARHLPGLPADAAGYVQAWQATGRAPAREQQIALTLTIGRALDGFTRSRWLRSSLRLMRVPAQAAGLSALQGFLESGFAAFGAMQGAGEFLRLVGERERALAAALFAADAQALAQGGAASAVVAQLP
jgi:hypothetical protein